MEDVTTTRFTLGTAFAAASKTSVPLRAGMMISSSGFSVGRAMGDAQWITCVTPERAEV